VILSVWAAGLVLAQVLDWGLRGTWLPVRSDVEPVHMVTDTCAGIPCEELEPSGVDCGPPYTGPIDWQPPAWWDQVWFRELAAVASITDAELEAEVMGYAITRMRGAV